LAGRPNQRFERPQSALCTVRNLALVPLSRYSLARPLSADMQPVRPGFRVRKVLSGLTCNNRAIRSTRASVSLVIRANQDWVME